MNNFLLDGIDNNSIDTCGFILRTSVDAIQEFKTPDELVFGAVRSEQRRYCQDDNQVRHEFLSRQCHSQR